MSKLFEPYSIGPLTFRNRFVRSATQDWLCEPDGRVSEAQLDLYKHLAAGGVGLIITGHSYVAHPHGRAAMLQNGSFDEKFFEGYKRLVETVQQQGAKIFLQLNHAGRQTLPDIIEGNMPIAPSDRFDDKGRQVARALTPDEIEKLKEAFETAAVRAKRAGFDGVQVHVAHGYLLAQFLSPSTNQRDDEYGGSREGRTALPAEIAYRVKAAVGRQFPVYAKLNTTDGINDPVQLSLEDAVYAAEMLAVHGVDAIETSGGTAKESRFVMAKPAILKSDQEAYFAPAAKKIKAAVKIPIQLVGGLRSVEVMESVIDQGIADMVSLSRPFVRELDLVNKLAAGQAKVTCVSCNACFNPEGLKCRYAGPSLQ
jgi:2,4-dienoyl-CoA reductase-like NADH-dependent reductase (Old Yellow Enzyme family)